ncbi:MAG: glycosyltransferase [Caldilineaceae bacterium]
MIAPKINISIALASYNGASYISEQLDSIIKQTYQPLEIIIQDDGSTDNTISILHHYQQKYPQFIDVQRNPTNLGFVKNFEHAIMRCSGEIIALSDQDDVWLPGRLEAIADTFISQPACGLIVTNAFVREQASTSPPKLLYPKFKQTQTAQDQRLDLLLRRYSSKGCTVAFRAKYLPYLLPVSATQWGHDHWIVGLLSLITQASILSEPLMYYRRHIANSGSDLLTKGWRAKMLAVKGSLPLQAYQLDYIRWQELLHHVNQSDNAFISEASRSQWMDGVSKIEDRLKYAKARA